MRIAATFFGLAGAGLFLWACSSSSSSPSSSNGSDAGGGDSTADVAAALPCNGHVELCGRSYTAVAFPGTHDAYATTEDHYVAADQDQTIEQQLEGGVRVLHMEIQLFQNDIMVCHSTCTIGKHPLADELATVSAFADAHPNEVISLLLESQGVTTDQVETAFATAAIEPKLHSQPAGTPWPTLGELVTSGKRIVVFLADLTQTGGTAFPFFHDRFARTWETPWNNQTPEDFTRCDADRGTKGNDVYVVDTYREDTPVATPEQAATVSKNPFLVDRLLTCKRGESTQPNFVMVNFYEQGDVLNVVDVLNGFAPEPSDLSGFPQPWPTDGGTDAGDAGDGG